jgi:restriction system protein
MAIPDYQTLMLPALTYLGDGSIRQVPSEADDYVRRISRRIVLIDGRTLARLMYDHGVGVRPHRSLEIKRIDEAYFEGDL